MPPSPDEPCIGEIHGSTGESPEDTMEHEHIREEQGMDIDMLEQSSETDLEELKELTGLLMREEREQVRQATKR